MVIWQQKVANEIISSHAFLFKILVSLLLDQYYNANSQLYMSDNYDEYPNDYSN